ncbi:hypothetical protein ARB14_32 [Bacteroides phage ARB14]|nr:hypothetical protein ARB14_32 [Bacteroides phage ARB14]
MEGRFEFMQHFIALGFIKLDSWVLSRRKPMSWDRTQIIFYPEDMIISVKIDKETMNFKFRYDQFKDAPTAYNVIKEVVRREYNKWIENTLKEIL